MNEAIVVLLLLWAVLLLPGALRSRNSSPHTTVGGFERAMDVLRAKPGQGRELMVPSDAGRIVGHGPTRPAGPPEGARSEDPVVARRRSWFLRLLAGTGLAFVVALAAGGLLWLLFVATLLITAGYTALLRHLKLQRDQARQVVRGIDLHREAGARPAAEEPAGRAVGGGQGPLAAAEEPVIDHVPAEDGGLALQSVRLRRWDD